MANKFHGLCGLKDLQNYSSVKRNEKNGCRQDHVLPSLIEFVCMQGLVIQCTLLRFLLYPFWVRSYVYTYLHQ